MRNAILLIDSDIGFLFWLGRLLDHAGYEAFPARSVPEAVALLRELHLTVSLLIFDCTLEGADDLVSGMRTRNRFLKTICLNGDGHMRCVVHTDAVCRKPGDIDEAAKSTWLQTVRSVLSASMLLV